MSAEKPTVVQALASVMEDVRAVRKGDRNTQQNYVFRGIDAVMNAAGPALRKHGVIVMPMVEDIAYRDVQTSTGKPSRECTVRVRYRFHGPAGDFIDCVTPGESMDFGDKGAPKAMSVAFRIALLQALCLPTDDPDPDSQQYERSTPIGRGEAPRNGQTEDTVTAARAALAKKCQTMGYDRGRVETKFREKYQQELGEATDPTRVRAFTKLLDGMPELDLKATA